MWFKIKKMAINNPSNSHNYHDENHEEIAFYQWNTVYPKKYAHGFVVLCFVVVMQSFIMNSHEVFIHIHQGCFAGTGVIVRLPQCQWSKPDGYGKIMQCITTTKHSRAKTVCIFLGIYCSKTPEQRSPRNHSYRLCWGAADQFTMPHGTYIHAMIYGNLNYTIKMCIWNQIGNNNSIIRSNTSSWPHQLLECMSLRKSMFWLLRVQL